MSFTYHPTETPHGSMEIHRYVPPMDANTLATSLNNLALTDTTMATPTSTTCTPRPTTVRRATTEHRIVDSFTARRRAFPRAAFQQDSDFIARRMEKRRPRVGPRVYITRAALREIARLRREAGVLVPRAVPPTRKEQLQEDVYSTRGEGMMVVEVREIQKELSMQDFGVWVREKGMGREGVREAQGPDMEGLCGRLEDVRV